MRLPTSLSRAMVDHLGSTYFHQIWNATNDHGRANFVLNKAAERLQTSTISVDLSVVGLPTTDTVYAVYSVSANVFGRFVHLPDRQWVSDSDLLLNDRVQLTTYAASGRTIPEGGIYLRYDPLKSIVLVAVNRLYTNKCIGETYPNLYMTVFFDTTRKTPTVTKLFTITKPADIARVTATIVDTSKDYPAGALVFINGWNYTPDQMPPLVLGDIIQLTCDPDMVGYCEIIVDDNETGYYSERYGEYREILHIPKLLNPNNVTITIDTLTLVAFDPLSGKGVYNHQIDNHAVESITHNDFSVSRQTLQAFQHALGSTEIMIRLYVRFPTDPQQLADDVNHLRDFYVLDDGEIKKQLAGLSDHQIDEWKASALERSPYLEMLYNFDYLAADNLLSRYNDAVGYYDVASTLAESLHRYTYRGSDVVINKPARLSGIPCDVIVYADGIKVPRLHLGVSNQGCTIRLGFKQDGYVKIGSQITVYITEAGAEAPVTFTPTVLAPSITVGHDDYLVVKVIDYSDNQLVHQGNVNKGYKVIAPSLGDYRIIAEADGRFTYKISNIHADHKFHLIPICGLLTQTIMLDEMLASKQALIFPLTMSDGGSARIPFIYEGMLEVYINGHRLIEDIDYTYRSVIGTQGDVLQQLLLISNQEYLDVAKSGNILEIVSHADYTVSVDRGYVIDNKMHRLAAPMTWSSNCGRAFARGLLVTDVTEQGNVLVADDNLVTGSPYLLEWTIPYGVKKLMQSLSAVSDENLRTEIARVLRRLPIVYPEIVVITDQYAIYSPYLAQIVYDVANGSYTIADEAKDDAFLRQFNRYAFLKQRDPVLISNPLLDRRFVTLAAHYANFPINNPIQMVLVQRLITLTLTPTPLSIDEVLI